MEYTNGPMEVNLKETGKRIRLQGTESIIGKMEESMKVTGTKIICTDKAYINGLTEDNMKVTILMTKKKAMVFTRTLMADAIKANGKMENNMVKDCL